MHDGRIEVSAARRLFLAPRLSGRPDGAFDVSSDGQHFLLNVATGESRAPVTVVLNWAAEMALARR